MPKSEGIKISSLVELYKRKQISREKVEKIFYEIGRALSKFHNKFMDKYKDKAKPGTILTPTIVHGDAHQANVFYDEKTNTVTLIDNERISSYSPNSPAWELKYFFLVTFDLFTSELIKNDQPFFNDWIYITMKSFMKGYMSIYPKDQWEQIVNEVYATMKEDKQRYEKYREAVDKVFNELRKEAEIRPQIKPSFTYYPQTYTPLWHSV
jgi:thiamine kinase-like enzyme